MGSAWSTPAQDASGSIRGTIYDADFDVPLALAKVLIVETEQSAETGDQGTYVLSEVPPGQYTLVFVKEGYVRQVRADVVVTAGRLTDVDVRLAGEFNEMQEFVVEDLQIGAGTEAALLELRFDSPALLDSVSSELMSRAGASDAASALRLVSGATIADGKFAVIRGLPDRYVSSQLNGVRLPSADANTRAVELDQFPSPVLESIQVSKTFTPDQQGDASGGAVDVRLRGIPEQRVLTLSGQLGINTEVFREDGFISYDGGGVNFWGDDLSDRRPQSTNGGAGANWRGPVGVTTDDPPALDYKGSVAYGNRWVIDDQLTVGAFGSFFYERDSSHTDDAKDDAWWVESPGARMTPQPNQGDPGVADFRTALFDVERSSRSVQWGGLTGLGLETDNHALAFTAIYTHTAEDRAILAEDTRGKEYYFPGYRKNKNDPNHPGNDPANSLAAPYIRTETIAYTERTTNTFQLSGEHLLESEDIELGSLIFESPTFDWYVADSFAGLDQPDKRQFGSAWIGPTNNPGFPPFVPPSVDPAQHIAFRPAANAVLGNLQRIFQTIEEDSIQLAGNLKWPFEQWDGEEGYVKVGFFEDQVDRRFDQNTFSNFADNSSPYIGGWNDFWSEVFVQEGTHLISPSEFDVDYDGRQKVSAAYSMMDLPLSESANLIFGARVESTDIDIVNDPEMFATWFPNGATQPQTLLPGEADVDFSQDDLLPSLGFTYEFSRELTLRMSYARTIARQTFRELTPILQQEFLGGPVFIGNPNLQMSTLDNYDLRLDYVPYEGGLWSASVFRKDIEDPIEYVQQVGTFNYTSPENYPEGRLNGIEFEVRQDMGEFSDRWTGLSLGANATLIDSKVKLPRAESALFNNPNIQVPLFEREMTNAPEYLYNLYATLDLDDIATQVSLFYTVQGDTLVAGAGQNNNRFVPSVFAEEFGTLNFSVSKAVADGLRLRFQAKNLTDPVIREVFRDDTVPGGDKTKTSFQRGLEFSISLSASF